MTSTLQLDDVSPVAAEDLLFAFERALSAGFGLMLFKGLAEDHLRAIEGELWSAYTDAPDKRVAVALRFRALIDVFKARRLKQLFLDGGLKIARQACAEAARQPLNVRFGFKPQAFVNTLGLESEPTTRIANENTARAA
ncbi:MAG: hypothetical protein ACRCS9_14405 [Hyphomicrobium sp.]